jgi:hypothetical protein
MGEEVRLIVLIGPVLRVAIDQRTRGVESKEISRVTSGWPSTATDAGSGAPPRGGPQITQMKQKRAGFFLASAGSVCSAGNRLGLSSTRTMAEWQGRLQTPALADAVAIFSRAEALAPVRGAVGFTVVARSPGFPSVPLGALGGQQKRV